MGLLLPTDALFEDLLPALQTWAGKVEGFGKWVDVPDLNVLLRNDGAGNSWTGGVVAPPKLSYTLLGDTMLLNIRIVNSTLVMATATNVIMVGIPPGFRVTGSTEPMATRVFNGTGWTLNPTYFQANFYASATAFPYANYLGLLRGDGGNWTDASGGTFTVFGSIAFEVVRL